MRGRQRSGSSAVTLWGGRKRRLEKMLEDIKVQKVRVAWEAARSQQTEWLKTCAAEVVDDVVVDEPIAEPVPPPKKKQRAGVRSWWHTQRHRAQREGWWGSQR